MHHLFASRFRLDGGTVTPGGNGRMIVALIVLSLLAILVWRTMEPGKFQQFTWLLLAFFGFRVVLARLRSR